MRAQHEQWSQCWTACPVFTGEPVTGRNHAVIVKFRENSKRILFLFFCGLVSASFFVFTFTFEYKLPYQFHCLKIQAMAFWLRPRKQAGGSLWPKTALRCKLPVLQQWHLGKKDFFSTYYKSGADFLNNDKENHQRYLSGCWINFFSLQPASNF